MSARKVATLLSGDSKLELHPQLKADREWQVIRRNRRNHDKVDPDALVFGHHDRRDNRANRVIVSETPVAVVVAGDKAAHYGEPDETPMRELRRPDAAAVERRPAQRVAKDACRQHPLVVEPAFDAKAGIKLLEM